MREEKNNRISTFKYFFEKKEKPLKTIWERWVQVACTAESVARFSPEILSWASQTILKVLERKRK